MNRTSVIIRGFVAAIVAAGSLLGCKPPSDPQVLNGTLREDATLDVSEYSRLVVPDTANVREGKHPKYVQIHLEKELAFRGHPPHPLHIEKARGYFGVATREEEGALVLGAYGEWTSKEGGACVRMEVIVPQGFPVAKRAGLSGDDSLAKPRGNSDWTDLIDNAEFRRCYWYTSISPGAGWARVETTPSQ